jgi:hypothetical protein
MIYELYEDTEYLQEKEGCGRWSLYTLNKRVAYIHLTQALVVLILIFVHFDKLPKDIAYVSGSLELKQTTYVLAVVQPNSTLQASLEQNTCEEVRGLNAAAVWHKEIPDIMPHKFYDFGGVSYVAYQKTGARLSPPWMMFAFFVLSFLFQIANGWLLNEDPDRPRLNSYFEYSVSSSLMIMVMGMNTGIFELYTLTSLFGLFFGMNMFGACAEWLCYVAEKAPYIPHIGPYTWVWPHVAGWILFMFAWIPCVRSFTTVSQCSDRHAPWFVVAMVVLESLSFFAFGLVQAWTLFARARLLIEGRHERNRVLYIGDACAIGLSVIAKTLLAWLLLAPMLSTSTS